MIDALQYDITRLVTNSISRHPDFSDYRISESYYRDGLVYLVTEDDREFEIHVEVTEVR